MRINVLRTIAFLCLIVVIAVSCKSRKSKELKAATPSPGVEVVKEKDPVLPQTTATPVASAPVKKAEEPKKEEKIKVQLPEVPREFRAAWIATVANINWPSKRNLTTAQQKEEAIHLLDILKNNNFNAVIFQVRPSSDALYDSKFEPWSYFLTGEIGKRPEPYYDPLEFWVEEAHKRGLELHVWLNPYRAHHTNGGQVTSKSMVNTASDYVVRLKNGMYWFDPADKRTQDHASRVVNDIVTRYDIDGVHFDDYFYPYASYNGGADFPDSKTWNVYKANGGDLSRGDWRRSHVNNFIERIYKEIKAEKPFVKFGLSPFGIWKPGYPAGISGSSQYDELYADAKLWLNKGWVDYFTPQLYWPIEPARQSFTALLKWWESENTFGRHLWPGLNTVEVRAAHKPTEIVNQINATRSIVPKSPGVVHWSIAGLTKNAEMLPTLANGPYKQKSLVPKSPWLKANPLLAPTLLVTPENGKVFAKWLHQQPEQVRHFIVYAKYGSEWEWDIVDSTISAKEFVSNKNGKKLTAVAVKAVDRLGNESEYEVKLF
jgi:uncharacterized lipoprotein YddW (UPF0748 family)